MGRSEQAKRNRRELLIIARDIGPAVVSEPLDRLARRVNGDAAIVAPLGSLAAVGLEQQATVFRGEWWSKSAAASYMAQADRLVEQFD